MPQFYTLLTDTGQAKLANAVALGGTIEITEMAVGDGGGSLPTPDSSATALINEVRRAPINTSIVDPDNPSWIVVEQVLPPDVGGWTIREIGIIDADGDLIGIGNYPETYKPVLAEGSSRTQTVRFVLEVSDTAAVTLKVDPSVVLATREHVAQERAEHAASRNHPLATTEDRGMVVRATPDQARGGAADVVPDAAGVLEALAFTGWGSKAVGADALDLDGTSPAGHEALTYVRIPPTSPFYPAGASGELTGFAQGISGDYGWTLVVEDNPTKGIYFRQKFSGGWGTRVRLFHSDDKASTAEAAAGAVDKLTNTIGVKQAISQHGLGVELPRTIPDGDFDQAMAQGFYAADNAALNKPIDDTDAVYGQLLVMSRNPDRKAQLYIDFGGRLWTRIMATGWQTWRRVYQSGETIDASAVPLATEGAKGGAEVATQGETDTGTADNKIVTPKKLKAWVKQATETVLGMLKVATQAQTDAGTDDATAVTPKKLRWGFDIEPGDQSAQIPGYVVCPTWMAGLTVQWGRNSDGTYTLPITFPTGAFTGAATYDLPGSMSTSKLGSISFPSASQVRIGVNNDISANMRWLVIGN